MAVISVASFPVGKTGQRAITLVPAAQAGAASELLLYPRTKTDADRFGAGLRFRHFVPKEELRPAAEVGGVAKLIAWDLGLKLQDVLEANPGKKFQAGETLVVPVLQGHAWLACASYYNAGEFNADGTRFDKNGISVAIKELPKGSVVTVEFLDTGVVVKHVVVRDSGPYYATCKNGLPRAVDLSEGLMKAGHIPLSQGVTRVKLTLESIPGQYLL